MSFVTEDFLLNTKTSVELYHKVAEKLPIFDYHCHLPEKEILEDKVFEDVYQVWLGGDHYKWRLMRDYGVDEEWITGSKSHKEKFVAYCKTLATAYGNPLYHWSHMELKAYFDCDLDINEKNADKIWDVCNAYIKKHKLSPVKLIKGSNVKHIFTTNRFLDDLTTFEKINSKKLGFDVYPAFRGDDVLNVDAPFFLELVNKIHVSSLDELEKAVEKKIDEYISVGCKATDISLASVLPITDKKDAAKVFAKRVKGKVLTDEDIKTYKGYMTYYLLKLFGKKDLATEIHLGATRNNNTVMFKKLGPDTGYDAISDENSTYYLSRLFDKLNTEGCLGRCIIFNLNKKMNTEFACLIGCFQDSSARGKIQYGAAWWFLDNYEGMINHLKDMNSLAHLGSYIGMLTDSRSFLSYQRHHYFRRILCRYLGELVEGGQAANDKQLLKQVVTDICINNSEAYFKVK